MSNKEPSAEAKKIAGKRYRCLIDGWKWSGTRHCTKRNKHAGRCGKREAMKPKLKSTVYKISFSLRTEQLLKQLTRSGFFGATIEETIDIAISRYLWEELRKGHLK